MPQLLKFYYEAIGADGKSVDGIKMAKSIEEAIFMLLQDGLYPSRIESLSGITGITYERLSRLKQLRDKLSPQRDEKAPLRTQPTLKKTNLLIVAIILFWLALVMLYLVL